MHRHSHRVTQRVGAPANFSHDEEFLAVPLSLAGGVFTLALTRINFPSSAAGGFTCLVGVAVLNGLVVMTAIREQIEGEMALAPCA
ncbi:MAG: hypothetical protein F9K30_13725 [Dechloromonas sp.]|nr:MAG: hypothetical protein F9K30_13725 [Dechloromonas sp.]